MDANKLQTMIIQNGITLKDISDLLGLSKAHTYQKLNDVKILTIREVIILKEFFELSDGEATEIFLGA